MISLELGHHLASTGVDPALLYQAEVDGLIHQAQHPHPGELGQPGDSRA